MEVSLIFSFILVVFICIFYLKRMFTKIYNTKTLEGQELNTLLNRTIPADMFKELLDMDLGTYLLFTYAPHHYDRIIEYEEHTGKNIVIHYEDIKYVALSLTYLELNEFLDIPEPISIYKYYNIFTGSSKYKTSPKSKYSFKTRQQCVSHLYWTEIYKFKNTKKIWRPRIQ